VAGQSHTSDPTELSAEELAGETAALLPAREAMSLIDPSLSGGGLTPDGTVMPPTDGGAATVPPLTTFDPQTIDSPLPLTNPLVG